MILYKNKIANLINKWILLMIMNKKIIIYKQ